MCIYAIEEELERVMREVSAGAIAGAARVACETPSPVPARGSPPFETRSDSVGEWKRFVIRVPLWYGDYGGTASVEIRAHRRPHATVVLMAFYDEEGRRSRDAELKKLARALE